MNQKLRLSGAIGLVSGVTIAGFFTLNTTFTPTFAQTAQSPHNQHHPGTNPQTQTPSPLVSPEGYQTGQMGQMCQMMVGDIDRHFIMMMIAHHEGAVDMAELALTRAQHPEIKQLAEAIIRDQNREIEQMQAWHQEWYGIEAPEMMSMGMMGGSSGSHTGMMSQHSENSMMGMHSTMYSTMHSTMMMHLEALNTAANFDQEFIRQMVPHHQMAVMMAQMVQDTASQPEIRELAQTIIETQTAEISQMQEWNQEWYQ